MDIARGLAIILIVMHHSRDYALAFIPPQPGDIIRWAYIDPFLVHVRLPLFFTLSGFVTFGAGSRTSNRLKIRRILSLAAVYVGWSFVMLATVPSWPNANWHVAGVKEYLGLLQGSSVLWYLWALVLAFCFTALTRSWSPWLACLAAGAVAALIGYQGQHLGGSWAAVGRYLPLYVLGARYSIYVLQLARWRSFSGAGLVIATYLIFLGPGISFPGSNFLLNGLGAALGILAAAWLVESWPALTSSIGWLGRRTLPIYVLHFPVVAFLGSMAPQTGLFHIRPLALLVFLPGLTIVTILSTLCLLALINRVGLAWTLATPGHLRA